MRTTSPRINYRQLVALSDAQLQHLANTPGHPSAYMATAELDRRYPPVPPQGILQAPMLQVD